MSATVHGRREVGVPEPGSAEPWLSTILRMGVHAITAAVFCWPLTSPGVAVFAGALSGLGALFGRVVGRTSLRLPVILALGLTSFLFALLLRSLAVDSNLLPAMLGPAGALTAGDALELGLGALAISVSLRAAQSRRPALAVLEVGIVGLAFAQLVVAHRHGAINRPFEVADPILSQGGDPTVALYAMGAAASVVIALLLLSERSLLRSAGHMLVSVVLLLVILGVTAAVGPPAPPTTGGGLGLREGEETEEQDQARSEGQRGERSNEELEFRDNYDNAANRVPIGVVLLHDDYSPPSGVYYFRQGAFSEYNGQRLVRATRRDVDADIARRFPARRLQIQGAPSAGADRAMLETTVGLLSDDHNRPLALESPISLEPATNPDSRRFRRIYRATSAALTADYPSMLGRRVGDPTWTEEQWSHYTEAPSDARYRELADRLLREELPEGLRGDPMAQAVAFSSWLGRNGVYSLRSQHSDDVDPTASFLFGDRTGYCVHFAHAMTYLMRSVGLPSRVATGYAVDESARQGGSAILLTGQMSHAWPEVHFERVGWVAVDVTPETVLSAPPPPPDPDLQRLLGELVRGQEPLPSEGPEMPGMEDVVIAAEGLVEAAGALLAMLLVLLFGAKLWRRASPLFASADALPRVAYRAELDRLSELSMRRRYGESREAFAARVAAVAPSFVSLTAAHLARAFGGQPGQQSRALARSVRREVSGSVPLWRRVLGFFIPWAWLLSR